MYSHTSNATILLCTLTWYQKYSAKNPNPRWSTYAAANTMAADPPLLHGARVRESRRWCRRCRRGHTPLLQPPHFSFWSALVAGASTGVPWFLWPAWLEPLPFLPCPLLQLVLLLMRWLSLSLVIRCICCCQEFADAIARECERVAALIWEHECAVVDALVVHLVEAERHLVGIPLNAHRLKQRRQSCSTIGIRGLRRHQPPCLGDRCSEHSVAGSCKHGGTACQA